MPTLALDDSCHLSGADSILSSESSISSVTTSKTPTDLMDLAPRENGSTMIFASSKMTSVPTSFDAVTDILSVVPEVEMRHVIDTSPVVAPMEDMFVLSENRFYQGFVDPTMGSDHSPSVSVRRIWKTAMKVAVSLGIEPSKPVPAAGISSRFVNLCPETGQQFFEGRIHECNLTGEGPRNV